MNIPATSQAPLSRSKKILFRIAALCITLVVTALLGEVTLRAMIHLGVYGQDNGYVMFVEQFERNARDVFGTVKKTGLFRVSRDPALGWEPIPGSSLPHITINSSGFRGEEYARTPKSKALRIAFLGDSETFGYALREEHTLPGCLERSLNARSKERRYEVLNFGVPGYNTAQESALLKKKAIHFNPSIVVLYYVLNDPMIADPVILTKGGLLSRSYLFMAIVYMVKSYTALEEIYQESPSLEALYKKLHHSEYFDIVKDQLDSMGASLHGRNIRFILVIAPEVIGFENWGKYPYKNIHEQLQALSGPGLEVFDPLGYLAASGYRPREFWVTKNDCHKNAKANEIIGAALAKYILGPDSGDMGQ